MTAADFSQKLRLATSRQTVIATPPSDEKPCVRARRSRSTDRRGARESVRWRVADRERPCYDLTK